MSCKCSHYNGEGRYDCDVSGDECMFFSPDSKVCAVIYGEGPDADNLNQIVCCCSDCGVDFTAKQLKSSKSKCPKCGGENLHMGSYDEYLSKRMQSHRSAYDMDD